MSEIKDNGQEIKLVSKSDLVPMLQKHELAKQAVTSISQEFAGYIKESNALVQKGLTIVVENEHQVEKMKEARDVRLELRKVRLKIESTRKELKDDIVKRGRAIDGLANALKYPIETAEKHLDKQEKFVQLLLEEKREKLIAKREKQLVKFLDEEQLQYYKLGEMSETAFKTLLENSKDAFEKAEKARVEAEEKEAKEREEQRLENERLKKEAEVKEKELAAEREKAEAERLEREKAEEKLRIEKERQRIREEAAAKAEKEAKEKAVKEARAKAAAPDIDKIKLYFDEIQAVELPEIGDKKLKTLMEHFQSNVKDLIQKSIEYMAEIENPEKAESED